MVRFLMKFNEGCRSLEPRARLDFLGPTPTPSSGAVANLLHSAGWPAKPMQVLSVKDGADECIGHFDGHYNRRVERLREKKEKNPIPLSCHFLLPKKSRKISATLTHCALFTRRKRKEEKRLRGGESWPRKMRKFLS
jgi:hypothetical protein